MVDRHRLMRLTTKVLSADSAAYEGVKGETPAMSWASGVTVAVKVTVWEPSSARSAEYREYWSFANCTGGLLPAVA